MVAERKWDENHIKTSLRQIDSNSWLFSNLVLHRLQSPSKTATWNDETGGSSYTISDGLNHSASASASASAIPFDSPHIKLIHEAGDASAVWSIGHSAIRSDTLSKGLHPK